MALPDSIRRKLRLPVIAAPMFIVSTPELVIAQCKAGIIGAIPALNARPKALLGQWLQQIEQALAQHDLQHPDSPAAPYAVNLVAHRSNARLDDDLALCIAHKVPVIITSLGVRPELNDAIHRYGGFVLHDIITNRHAKSAIDKGADGVIAVAAGAGGHTGTRSPFALVHEIRAWFDGPLVLAGAISTGRAILAAQAAGADLAYVGSSFIATAEANAAPAYQQMLVDGSSDDILYSNFFTGVHGNFLRPSIVQSGLDPDQLPARAAGDVSLAATSEGDAPQRWKTIWGAGHGIAAVRDIPPAGQLVERLHAEYREACAATTALARQWTS